MSNNIGEEITGRNQSKAEASRPPQSGTILLLSMFIVSFSAFFGAFIGAVVVSVLQGGAG